MTGVTSLTVCDLECLPLPESTDGQEWAAELTMNRSSAVPLLVPEEETRMQSPASKPGHRTARAKALRPDQAGAEQCDTAVTQGRCWPCPGSKWKPLLGSKQERDTVQRAFPKDPASEQSRGRSRRQGCGPRGRPWGGRPGGWTCEAFPRWNQRGMGGLGEEAWGRGGPEDSAADARVLSGTRTQCFLPIRAGVRVRNGVCGLAPPQVPWLHAHCSC